MAQSCGQEAGLAFIGGTARRLAGEVGRPADQRITFAYFAAVDLAGASGDEARCVAVADAILAEPVATEVSYRWLADDCSAEWRAATAQRLEAAAVASPASAGAWRALAVWVSKGG
jgi:hypothetical protein